MKQDYDKEIEEAAQRYEEGLANNSLPYFDASELSDLSYYYEDKENPDRALDVANYGLKLHPGHLELTIQKGYLILRIMGTESAQSFVETIAEQNDPEVILLRTQILLQSGSFKQAETLLDTLMTKQLDSSYLINETAFLYCELGKSEKGTPLLKNFLKNNPNDIDSLLSLSQILFNEGQYEESLKLSDKLTDIDPYNINNWEININCNYQIGEYEKALDSIELALAINPHSSNVHISKAHCLFTLRNFKEAIKEYQAGIDYNTPFISMAYYYQGLSYRELHNGGKAIDCFYKSIDYLTSTEMEFCEQIYYILIRTLCEENKIEEAESMYNKCINEQESDLLFLKSYVYAFILFSKGEYDKASEKFQVALDNYPVIEYYSDIITLYIENEKLDHALLFTKHCKEHLKEEEWMPTLGIKLYTVEILCSIAQKHGIEPSEISFKRLNSLISQDTEASEELSKLQKIFQNTKLGKLANKEKTKEKIIDNHILINQLFIN